MRTVNNGITQKRVIKERYSTITPIVRSMYNMRHVMQSDYSRP